MIPHDTISNILSTAKIEEVVGDFVSLKRRGVNYIGLCPFHNEKTPSFTVSPSKGIYKCFGCGKAGNAVNFLMEHEHFTYPEALRELAKRYNIEIEEEKQTPEKIQEQNEKESLFLLNQYAQKYFEQVLHETEEGKAVGLSYFRERLFNDNTIRKFQLGYSPENWDSFTENATANGYKPEYLVKTGLSLQKETRLMDRFHGRVIFPIHSASGRIIGFGGRVLKSDKHLAKYINSPESEIYNKSKSLYGLFFAKNALIAKDTCLLVEGYTDVISLHQAGIENVVASSGTSLTQEQIKLIQRYTANITILYDGDPAGIKASMRGIDMILEHGMNVRIVLFPEGEDPDSFVRKNRVAEVETFIAKNAVNFILFKTRLLLEETAGDPIKKAALIKEIVNTISLIPDGISRSLYIKECAGVLGVQEQTLLNEINKIFRKKFTKKDPESLETEGAGVDFSEPPAPSQMELEVDSSEAQERAIIRLLLLYANEILIFKEEDENKEMKEIPVKVGDFIIHDIQSDELSFDDPVCQQIFNEMAASLEQEKIADKDHFFHHTDINISTLAIDLCVPSYELSTNWKKNRIYVDLEHQSSVDSINSAVLTFKVRKIDRMILDISNKLKEAGSDEEAMQLLDDWHKKKEISSKIHSQLGGGRIVIK
ncbi:MAG: DNA primase [Bacteroidetes bacterium]|nr:DNA primase [Bacteroidota bacterium]